MHVFEQSRALTSLGAITIVGMPSMTRSTAPGCDRPCRPRPRDRQFDLLLDVVALKVTIGVAHSASVISRAISDIGDRFGDQEVGTSKRSADRSSSRRRCEASGTYRPAPHAAPEPGVSTEDAQARNVPNAAFDASRTTSA